MSDVGSQLRRFVGVRVVSHRQIKRQSGRHYQRTDSAMFHIPSEGEALRCMRACNSLMGAAVTSIRVSRETLRDLERLKQTFRTDTAEATIRRLIRESRSKALARMFGSGRGRVTPFSEADRLVSDY